MSQEDRALARVGARVAARRGQLRLKSQRQLAKLAQVNLNTINALETGSRWPQAATRAKIEKALGWEERSLQAIHDGGEPTPLDKEEATEQAGADSDDPVAQIRAIEGLDDDERDLIALFVAQMLKTRRTPTDTNAQHESGSEGRKGA